MDASSKARVRMLRNHRSRFEPPQRAAERIRQQLEELQQWYDLMLSREERVMELKGKVNAVLR